MENEKYLGNIIKVTEEKIGSIVWERAYLPDGVIVFPITDKGEIILIKEKRPHETPSERIKPISGILEKNKGTPEENAQREMQEEIGFKSENMEHFWTLKSSGTINNCQYFFIARNLASSKLPNPDGEDTIVELLKLTPKELLNFVLNDQMKWSMSTLGIFRLLQILDEIKANS